LDKRAITKNRNTHLYDFEWRNIYAVLIEIKLKCMVDQNAH